jgi:hypothetical protein
MKSLSNSPTLEQLDPEANAHLRQSNGAYEAAQLSRKMRVCNWFLNLRVSIILTIAILIGALIIPGGQAFPTLVLISLLWGIPRIASRRLQRRYGDLALQGARLPYPELQHIVGSELARSSYRELKDKRLLFANHRRGSGHFALPFETGTLRFGMVSFKNKMGGGENQASWFEDVFDGLVLEFTLPVEPGDFTICSKQVPEELMIRLIGRDRHLWGERKRIEPVISGHGEIDHSFRILATHPNTTFPPTLAQALTSLLREQTPPFDQEFSLVISGSRVHLCFNRNYNQAELRLADLRSDPVNRPALDQVNTRLAQAIAESVWAARMLHHHLVRIPSATQK